MNWIRRLFGRAQVYQDLSDEIRQHLDERVDTLVQGGMPREEAMATARREFGNVTALEERGREVWQWPTIESILFDVRYALRQLRRQPSFTIVAILILGLGIGANTAVFSVVDRLLFEPLAFRDPDRLVWIQRMNAAGRIGRSWEVADYEKLREMDAFEDLTTYEMAFARSSYKLSGDGDPDRVAGVMVPANFFPFLGTSPMVGRSFTETECQRNGPGAVILGHGLWQRRYSGRTDVIGRQVMVNDRAATIVGVMPPSFDFGAVFAPGVQIDVYMPAVFDVLRDWGPTMAVLARHKPGASAAATQSAINALLSREFDRTNAPAQRRYSFRGRSLPRIDRRRHAPSDADPVGGGRSRAADRLHQPGEPAARSGGSEAKRDGPPQRHRRQPRAPGQATADGEFHPLHGRRRPRRRDGVRVHRLPAAPRRGEHSVAAECGDQRDGARGRVRGQHPDGGALRPRSGDCRRARKPRRVAQGRSAWSR